MNCALGIIEVIGKVCAASVLDACCKTAEVELIGYDKVIGVGGYMSFTLELSGEVAAVTEALNRGADTARSMNRLISYKVIPRPHEELDKLLVVNRVDTEEQSYTVHTIATLE